MTYSLTWLPGVLRDAGLEVLEHPGWQTRGHDDMGAVQRALPSHLRPSAWSGRARAGTPAPGTDGNSHFIGVEAENTGDTTGPRAEAWPDVQMQAYMRVRAAIVDRLGIGVVMVAGHNTRSIRGRSGARAIRASTW